MFIEVNFFRLILYDVMFLKSEYGIRVRYRIEIREKERRVVILLSFELFFI